MDHGKGNVVPDGADIGMVDHRLVSHDKRVTMMAALRQRLQRYDSGVACWNIPRHPTLGSLMGFLSLPREVVGFQQMSRP